MWWLLPLLVATPAFAQGEVETTRLTDDVLVVHGLVSNLTAVRTGDGLVVVDALISPLHAREARRAMVEAFGDLPVRYLVQTHHHPDHTFGMQEFPEATVVTHRNTAAKRDGPLEWAAELVTAPEQLEALRARLSDKPARKDAERAAILEEVERWEKRLARYSGFRSVEADLILDGDATFAVGGKTVHVRHPGAGHTDGDLVVWFADDGVLATGDLVFHGIVPVFDTDGGIDLGGWRDTVRGLAGTEGLQHVVPGHGAPGDASILTAQADYLAWVLGEAQRAHESEQTADQAVEAAGTGPYADLEPMFGDVAGNVRTAWELLDDIE